ncbi:MAG TPA: biopolymer transporter ExbD [Candidatus Krumholzibacteriaceae bacterium]
MRRSRHNDVNAEINIINLVDVMMVLLIIFMLAAPLLQQGVKLTLPKAEAKQLEQEGVTVSIDENSAIYINDRPVAWNDFSSDLQNELTGGVPRVFLKVDRSVQYDIVLKVIARVKMMGIEDLGLVASEEK